MNAASRTSGRRWQPVGRDGPVAGGLPSRFRSACIGLALLLATGAQAAEEVVLEPRPQPGRDLRTDLVVDSIHTLRVLEDRGIVARSDGRLSSGPVTAQVVGRQAFRLVTGAADAAGRFPVELTYLDKRTELRTPDGRLITLTDSLPWQRARVQALLEPDGRLVAGTVSVTGVDGAVAEPTQRILAEVLAQASAVEPVTLGPGRSATQRVTMKLPVPGIATVDVTMQITSQLLGVEAGVARVQQVYGMDFGVPDGPLRLRADGSGSGTLRYEVATRTLLSSESHTLMKLVFDGPDGVVEAQMVGRQSQTTQPTPPAATPTR